MKQDGTRRENIFVGQRVSINPQNDRSRKVCIDGNVDEILSNTSTHSHGILVRLNDGTIGRVRKVLDCSHSISKANVSSESGLNKNANRFSIKEIISKGENHFIEFKTSILWSKFKTKNEIHSSKSYELKKYGQNTSKYIIAKSICGFLNSDGGNLIVGVKEIKDTDNIEIVGVESEFKKLKDQTQDGYRRMILDEIIKPFFPSQIFNHFNNYIELLFEEIDGKTVLCIRVKPSDVRVFVSIANDEIFFVRIDASTRQLSGPDLVDYCARRFK